MAKTAKLTKIPEGTPELRFGISGRALLMRPALTLGQKDKENPEVRKGGGNLVWGVMKSTSTSLENSGIVIPALADELPTEAVVYDPTTKEKFTVALEDGPATFTDKDGVTTDNSPHKVYKGEHQVPGTEVTRVLTVKVTARKDSGWNLKAILTNAGGSPVPVEDIFADDDLVEGMFA